MASHQLVHGIISNYWYFQKKKKKKKKKSISHGMY